MLIFLALVSFALLAILFAVGALSLPMIADRNCGVIEAMQASLRTLRKYRVTMAVWVTLIASVVGLAFISNLMLMPVVFPLLAYATWHSYRQLSPV